MIEGDLPGVPRAAPDCESRTAIKSGTPATICYQLHLILQAYFRLSINSVLAE